MADKSTEQKLKELGLLLPKKEDIEKKPESILSILTPDVPEVEKESQKNEPVNILISPENLNMENLSILV